MPAEGFTSPYIAQNINAGLLSPAILHAICEGRQPPHLTAKLLGQIELPDQWSEQAQALQFKP
jgi:hypothetical protein